MSECRPFTVCFLLLVSLQGQPKVFSAGLDILEMYGKSPERCGEFWKAVQEMWLKLYSSNMVTIAAINVCRTHLSTWQHTKNHLQPKTKSLSPVFLHRVPALQAGVSLHWRATTGSWQITLVMASVWMRLSSVSWHLFGKDLWHSWFLEGMWTSSV